LQKTDNQSSPDDSTLLFLVTEDWYFCLHRLPLARAAKRAGLRVIVATRIQDHGDIIKAEGFDLVPLSWRRTDGPLGVLRSLYQICAVYGHYRPNLVHHVSLKPIILGSIAAWITGIRRQVQAITGLGYAFSSNNRLARLLRPAIVFVLRKFADRPGSIILVENVDDRDQLVASGAASPERFQLIRGSGVDVTKFLPSADPPGPITATMVSRMLRDKGVDDLAAAAALLAAWETPLQIQLIGPIDPDNPSSYTAKELHALEQTSNIKWQGPCDDIPSIWRRTHIAVLPSRYREGIPVSLLEAAASSRPMISTDMPGCREIVIHDTTGLLVPSANPAALAEALRRLALDPELRSRLGRQARLLVDAEFGLDRVIEATLAAYRTLGLPVPSQDPAMQTPE
jgi:glycosyltransferase involved in cell wall biosynthesis